jgi:hypothetical protein
VPEASEFQVETFELDEAFEIGARPAGCKPPRADIAVMTGNLAPVDMTILPDKPV